VPFAFSGQSHQTVAKLGVVSDGDTFTGAPTVLVQGSAATLTLVSTTITLTGGAGFVSGMTGDKIFISNAATPANNGWFTLTFVSATSVSWTNASGATDAHNGAIGWKVAVLGASTLSSAPSPHTCFTAAPVRSAVGVWSITTKDNCVTVCDVDIVAVLPSGVYLDVQQITDTAISTTGQKILNWVFLTRGTSTPADLPFPGQFRVALSYSETKVGY
jgi:hypothetical protein